MKKIIISCLLAFIAQILGVTPTIAADTAPFVKTKTVYINGVARTVIQKNGEWYLGSMPLDRISNWSEKAPEVKKAPKEPQFPGTNYIDESKMKGDRTEYVEPRKATPVSQKTKVLSPPPAIKPLPPVRPPVIKPLPPVPNTRRENTQSTTKAQPKANKPGSAAQELKDLNKKK